MNGNTESELRRRRRRVGVDCKYVCIFFFYSAYFEDVEILIVTR